ncbi:MAG: UPF0175 family protein [Candidatus Bathyarchaeia archaeon]
MYRLQTNVNIGTLTEIISTRIPDEMAKDLKEIESEEKTDRATLVRKLLAKAIEQWKIERALRLYREGKVTLWRAARLGGITLREMMELAAKQEIRFNYTARDLEEDIEAAIVE